MNNKHAIFILKHNDSESRAFMECRKSHGKIKISGVSFVKGNVIELEAVKEAIRVADDMLV